MGYGKRLPSNWKHGILVKYKTVTEMPVLSKGLTTISSAYVSVAVNIVGSMY